MTNLLLATIAFPPDGNLIERLVYSILEWIMGWGWVGYGLAIIIFTVIIKLIMMPLDFTNRYFTKKNQISMAKIAPEEKALRETYGNDPMALQRARQDLYRREGVGQGGLCLVMLVNLAVTLIVFWSVFSGLRSVASYNIKNQVSELSDLYITIRLQPEEKIVEQLNAKYEETRVTFLWVKNIWQPDTWSKEIMTYEEYTKAIEKYGAAVTEDTYNLIFDRIKTYHDGWGPLHWNGMLMLVFLAGITTFASTWLSSFVNRKNTPQKAEGTKAEPIISYSLRDAKRQSAGNTPEIDAAQVTQMMQIIMPIVMITFALTSTAAMAIYIISSSLVSTGLTLGLGAVVDLIIKNQKPKAGGGKAFDPTVINPHAKYFKNKGSEQK